MGNLFERIVADTALTAIAGTALILVAAALGASLLLRAHRKRAKVAWEPEGSAAPGIEERDPAQTIAGAVRLLRIRYIAVICVLSLLGIAFVVGSHRTNETFSNATSMAVLVAKAAEITERTARTAREMANQGSGDDAEWTEEALEVHAERLADTIEEMKVLNAHIGDDLKRRLLVDTPYGTVEAIGLLEEFQAEIARAVEGSPSERASAGKYIDGTIGYMVQPALMQQAAALRQLNRETADGVKVTINIVAAVLAAFVAAILLLIFVPMERSIRTALARLKTAIEGATAADRTKSEFLANMSHEIRTPMNGVLGMAELMANTELDARQKTYTDVIVKSGNALLTIINDILDFSKIDAGHTELDPAPFKLHEAVEDVATLVSSGATEKDLELIVRVDPALPEYVVGDVGRVRQILTNLAGNAVKFTETGHVLIDVSKDGDGILFEVSDTGIGIPPDKLPTVFEKFSQIDTSSTRRHEGTGLGLAIAARLVELMEGTMSADSTPGEGSTFRFRIPLVAHEGPRDAPAADADLRGARVLIIDDNTTNRDILIEMTRHWEFDTCGVESGRVALELMQHAHAIGAAVDAVILDYQMPDMNGAEVLRAVRSNEAIAQTPVILLTSVDHRAAMRELKSAGADAILTKPTRSALLLATIGEALRRGKHARATPPPAEAPADSGPAEAKIEESGTKEAVQPRAPAVQPAARSAVVANDVAVAAEAVPAASEAPAEKASGNPDRLTILVAEDNEVNQLVFTQILGDLDYSFAIVGDGREAVEAWRERRPELILMDVSMPNMNGFEATAAIREAEAAEGLQRTPIMGVTAHALKDDRERCLNAGMDDYLTKPVSPVRLETKIDEWLKVSEAKRA